MKMKKYTLVMLIVGLLLFPLLAGCNISKTGKATTVGSTEIQSSGVMAQPFSGGLKFDSFSSSLNLNGVNVNFNEVSRSVQQAQQTTYGLADIITIKSSSVEIAGISETTTIWVLKDSVTQNTYLVQHEFTSSSTQQITSLTAFSVKINNAVTETGTAINPETSRIYYGPADNTAYMIDDYIAIPAINTYAKKGNMIYGGVPLNYVWNRYGGIGVGVLTDKPDTFELPITVSANTIELSVKYSPNPVFKQQTSFGGVSTVKPAFVATTLKSPVVFVTFNNGDFYAPLNKYTNLLDKISAPTRKIQSAIVPTTAKAPYWKTWGLDISADPSGKFTKDDIRRISADLKTLNIQWILMDWGWFTAEGDWTPNPDVFTDETDLAAFITEMRGQGFHIGVWYQPLQVDVSDETVIATLTPYLVKNANGTNYVDDDGMGLLDPSLPQVQTMIDAQVNQFANWGAELVYLDSQIAQLATPPNYALQNPLDSHNSLPVVYDIIRKVAKARNLVVETCPDGRSQTILDLPIDINNVGDPKNDRALRAEFKTLKAIRGSKSIVTAYVDAFSDNPVSGSFLNIVGPGGKIETMFNTPNTAGLDKWKAWMNFYYNKDLVTGDYLDIYDIAFDYPEGHVVKKGTILYYSFFTNTEGLDACFKEKCTELDVVPVEAAKSSSYNGAIVFKGLEPFKSYTATPYNSAAIAGLPISLVTDATGRVTITATFDKEILYEVILDAVQNVPQTASTASSTAAQSSSSTSSTTTQATSTPTQSTMSTPTQTPTTTTTQTPTPTATQTPTATSTQTPTVTPTQTPTVASTTVSSSTPTQTLTPKTNPKSMHYQLQQATYTSLKLVNVDAYVVDIEDSAMTKEQVLDLRTGGKIVLSYISIGEAESYREYWDKTKSWIGPDGKPTAQAPLWLDNVNPDWSTKKADGTYDCNAVETPCNCKVKYWDPAWQAIIIPKIKKIAENGYSGAFLDIVDGYQYYQDNPDASKIVPDADIRMAAFVTNLRAAAREVNPDFLIVPQNAVELYPVSNYKTVIDGFSVEDTWYNADVVQDATHTNIVLPILDSAIRDGKFVLSIDYPTQQDKICDYYSKCAAHGFACTVSDRLLSSPAPAKCTLPQPTPTIAPTQTPTAAPTTTPTQTPTLTPTVTPTITPTQTPTATPTITPTTTPTPTPTAAPTTAPTQTQTVAPTTTPAQTSSPTPIQTPSPTSVPNSVSTPPPELSVNKITVLGKQFIPGQKITLVFELKNMLPGPGVLKGVYVKARGASSASIDIPSGSTVSFPVRIIVPGPDGTVNIPYTVGYSSGGKILDGVASLTVLRADYIKIVDVTDQIASADFVFVIGKSGKLKDSEAAIYSLNALGIKKPGAIVFDSTLADADIFSKNLVIVGGPCTNRVAAVLFDIPWENNVPTSKCSEAFDIGTGGIRVFENNGKKQVVIAGASADDTRRAMRVFTKSDYRTKLSSSFLQVCGSGLDVVSDCVQKCDDGTLYGACQKSLSAPGAILKFCNYGELIDKCSVCGCPSRFACQILGMGASTFSESCVQKSWPIGDIISAPAQFDGKIVTVEGLCGSAASKLTYSGCAVKPFVEYAPGISLRFLELVDDTKCLYFSEWRKTSFPCDMETMASINFTGNILLANGVPYLNRSDARNIKPDLACSDGTKLNLCSVVAGNNAKRCVLSSGTCKGDLVPCPIFQELIDDCTCCSSGKCSSPGVCELPRPVVCSDGTPSGQCSAVTKPNFCENNVLSDKCGQCGCPSGQTCNTDGTCSVPALDKCSDGTPINKCSTVNPNKYCYAEPPICSGWGPCTNTPNPPSLRPDCITCPCTGDTICAQSGMTRTCVLNAPYCANAGSKSEGWYQKVNGVITRIKWGTCAASLANCQNPGTANEGWYNPKDGSLIKLQSCYAWVNPVSIIGTPAYSESGGRVVLSWNLTDNSVKQVFMFGKDSNANTWSVSPTGSIALGTGEKYALENGTTYYYKLGQLDSSSNFVKYIYTSSFTTSGTVFVCSDTDAGNNPNVKGTVSGVYTSGNGITDGPYSEKTDYCSAGAVLENYCTAGKNYMYAWVSCPYGCSDGACNKDSPFLTPFTGTCRETDKGKDYYAVGFTQYGTLASYTTYKDECVGSQLNEGSCGANNNLVTEGYACQYGCKDGACICPAGSTCSSPTTTPGTSSTSTSSPTSTFCAVGQQEIWTSTFDTINTVSEFQTGTSSSSVDFADGFLKMISVQTPSGAETDSFTVSKTESGQYGYQKQISEVRYFDLPPNADSLTLSALSYDDMIVYGKINGVKIMFPEQWCAGLASGSKINHKCMGQFDCLPAPGQPAKEYVPFTADLTPYLNASLHNNFEIAAVDWCGGSVSYSATLTIHKKVLIIPVYPASGAYVSKKFAPNNLVTFTSIGVIGENKPAGTDITYEFLAYDAAGNTISLPAQVYRPDASGKISLSAISGMQNAKSVVVKVNLIASADKKSSPSLDRFDVYYTAKGCI